jgi:hypothetical protein
MGTARACSIGVISRPTFPFFFAIDEAWSGHEVPARRPADPEKRGGVLKPGARRMRVGPGFRLDPGRFS